MSDQQDNVVSLDEARLERAAMQAAENFGAAQDVFVPGYGWIMKDGRTTEAGERWHRDNYE